VTDTTIGTGSGHDYVRLENVESSDIDTGSGHDYVRIDEVVSSTIHTGAGHDSVMLEDVDETAVHTGEGSDFLSFTTADPTAQVAYNPGDERDFGYIEGGTTLGMLRDGDADTFIFNADEGGQHEVFADNTDQLMIHSDGVLWDAEMIDFVDQGGQDGTAELGDFSLAMHMPEPELMSSDFFLG
jgi:hypothetical protein